MTEFELCSILAAIGYLLIGYASTIWMECVSDSERRPTDGWPMFFFLWPILMPLVFLSFSADLIAPLFKWAAPHRIAAWIMRDKS